ncbi:plant PDR ABC transporter associated [Artemisia annua]|uniref:Plant PDR ABC transporter associated n=1 Tax=Artemisia annua TaxID=35608 RepID=A0A2U1LMM9_ARTAN|nr:plant PDR ABC transporter associated [Artemisia annua]
MKGRDEGSSKLGEVFGYHDWLQDDGVHDKMLSNSLLDSIDEDHILRRLRERIDSGGTETIKIEVRYENLSVEGCMFVGHRAHPSLYNVTFNAIEAIHSSYLYDSKDCRSMILMFYVCSGGTETIKIEVRAHYDHLGSLLQKRKNVNTLRSITGIIKPSRMTLLLGPPGAGKTTLLLALAGKLDKDLNVSGNITYCGHQLSEFIPQRTCTYISPNNLHTGEMTVRETLNFSGRCLGVGPRYRLLSEILKKEKEAENSFMNTTTLPGTETNLITDYVLKADCNLIPHVPF